jgi:hypothetical protein
MDAQPSVLHEEEKKRIKRHARSEEWAAVLTPSSANLHSHWQQMYQMLDVMSDLAVQVSSKDGGVVNLVCHAVVLFACCPGLRERRKLLKTFEGGVPPRLWWRSADSPEETNSEPPRFCLDLTDLGIVDSIFIQVLKWIYGQACELEIGSTADMQEAVKLLQVATLERALAHHSDADRRTHAPDSRHTTPARLRSDDEAITPDVERSLDNPRRLFSEEFNPPDLRRIVSNEKIGHKKSFNRDSWNHESDDSGETSRFPRRVLSDLKGTVESSRVIADKSFSAKYEMMEGEGSVLGEGINGPVRKAISRDDGREAAVKTISTVNLSEQRKQMVVSELRIFLQVHHRNVVQLLEVYESERAVLLVMEVCTGGELFERLAKRKFYTEIDAAKVTEQMVAAVSYLHGNNICHRDLKLENWLYESDHPDAALMLCDFGFGQVVEPSAQLHGTMGSLYYIAPEVLEGSVYGLPCDIWSLGVIVYMLISGTPPFIGDSDWETTELVKPQSTA